MNKFRQTKNLRKGRISIPFARYFITLCSHSRKDGLTDPLVAEKIRESLRQQHREKDFEFLCGTIMPDHCHLLFRLLVRINLSQSIAKLKMLTKETLATHSLFWQENFYDHRLRSHVSTDSFARYQFLNPYRKNLIKPQESWPWWMCNKNFRPAFLQHLSDTGHPPPQWINQGRTIDDLIEEDLERSDEHNNKS